MLPIILALLFITSPAWCVTVDLTGSPVSATTDLSCAGTRAASNLGCNANEFTVSSSFSARPGTPPFCVVGESFSFLVDLQLSGSNTDRYDPVFYAGQTGNAPNLNNSSNLCSVAAFPNTLTAPWANLDKSYNTCADYTGGGDSIVRVNQIKVLCKGDPLTGNLQVPFVLAYEQSAQKSGTPCSPTDETTFPIPSSAKCVSGISTVSGSVKVFSGAYIDVQKVTIPAGDTEPFSFSAAGPTGSTVIALTPENGGTYHPPTATPGVNSIPVTPDTITIKHGETARFFMNALATVQPLTITETPLPAGWEPTASISCTNLVGTPVTNTAPNPNPNPNNATRTITGSMSTTNAAATCTITNTKKPKVRIEKTSNNGTGTFTYTLTNIATGNDSITTDTAGVAKLGAYDNFVNDRLQNVVIMEAVPSGWPANPVSASCVDTNYLKSGNGSGSFGSRVDNVLTVPAANLLPGAEIICSFINTKPTVQVRKTSNNGAGTFAFAGTNGVAANFNIATVTAGTPASGAVYTVTSAATAITIAETAPSGWPANPTSASCRDTNYLVSGNPAAPFGSLNNNVLTIPAVNLKPAAQIVCDFVNTAVATITVNKTLVPSSDPGKFNLRINGSAVATDIGNGGSGTVIVPANTAATVDETAGTATSLTNYVSLYSCAGGYTATNVSGSTVSIPSGSVTPGSTTTCTFTNSRKPVLTKAFLPTTINEGESSVLSFTITNLAGSTAQSGLTFTDTMPANLVIATTPNVVNGCGGSPTITASGNSFNIVGTGVNAAAGPSTCTVSVNVTSYVANSAPGYVNGAAQITAISANLENSVTDQTLVVFGLPNISMLKSSHVVSDPVNNASNPKAIPGAQILYTITATNFGAGAVDAGSMIISDPLPAAVSLVVAASPVTCTNGTPTSGITFNCGAYNNASDDVFFSKDGTDWSYTPVVGVNNTDPLLRYLQIKPPATSGQFNAASGGNNPTFTIRFNVIIN